MAGFIFWLCVLSVFYVYAGYPLLVTMLAGLRPRPHPYPEIEPTITLLIAAYDEEEVITTKLENCLHLDYPRDRLQILVAVDGAADRTTAIVQSYAARGIEMSHASARLGKAAAINRAMPMARHDIVVFSDANNLYAPQSLRLLVRPFHDKNVGATTGSKNIVKSDSRLADADNLYWRYESFIKKRETQLGGTVGVAGEIMAIRRALFLPLPEKIINDDFFIALTIIKQGARIVYVPKARSHEIASLNEQDEQIRRSRIIAGRYQAIFMSLAHLPYRRPLLVWQIFSHKFLRPLVPFAMIGALLANLVALLFPSSLPPTWLHLAPPLAALFLALQLGFYLAAGIGAVCRPGGPIGKLLYLPTFLFNSNYSALLGLLRYLAGQQTSLWKKAARRS